MAPRLEGLHWNPGADLMLAPRVYLWVGCGSKGLPQPSSTEAARGSAAPSSPDPTPDLPGLGVAGMCVGCPFLDEPELARKVGPGSQAEAQAPPPRQGPADTARHLSRTPRGLLCLPRPLVAVRAFCL